MSLNFLILKFLIPNRNIIPVFTPPRVSVKLEGDVVVAGLVRLIICKLATVLMLLSLPTNYALATWHGRGQSLCRWLCNVRRKERLPQREQGYPVHLRTH